MKESGFALYIVLALVAGFVFHPETGKIWATENGRDHLGDDLPPDEINIVTNGKHYG